MRVKGANGVAGVGVLLAFTAVAFVVFLLYSGCRTKESPVGPGDGATGLWRLVLLAPDTMFRNYNGGWVPNDTIRVRVFYNNVLEDSIRIRCQCQISRDSISAAHGITLTVADTVTRWWGCEPALHYYGCGPDDPSAREIVDCWAVRRATGDTLAHARVAFHVWNPSWSLQLRPPQIMLRNRPGGWVENDTIIVRMFRQGRPVANILLDCQCRVSRDSISAAVAQVTTRADTLVRWWGCEPPLMYWGRGPRHPDSTEVVDCWAVHPVRSDTVAYAQTRFFVRDP